MGEVITLTDQRNRRRLAEFNETIQHFIEIAQDANRKACDLEAAKYRFMDANSIPPDAA